MALSDIVREEEKLTGGFGPLRSIAGRIDCLLLDMIKGEVESQPDASILRCSMDISRRPAVQQSCPSSLEVVEVQMSELSCI